MSEQSSPRQIPEFMLQQIELMSWKERLQLGHELTELGQRLIQEVKDEFEEAMRPPAQQVIASTSIITLAPGEPWGHLLQSYRLQAGIMTQQELANASGLNVATINRLERTEFPPRPTTLPKLAKGLGWKLDDPRYIHLRRLAPKSRRSR